MVFCYILLCFAALAFVHSSPFEKTPGERELRRDLFRDYDKNTRPVEKYANAVPVNISLSPLSLTKLDETDQIMTLDTWILLTWKDDYLKWNSDDYDGITELRVSPDQVWRPDIALYTGTPDTSMFPTVKTQVLLYSSGTLLWVPPFTINNRCPISSQRSEKAYVECNIRMGSWTYSEKMLDLRLGTDEVDLSDFVDSNPTWKLFKVVFSREAKIYDCCPDAYPSVDFNITFKRRNYYQKSPLRSEIGTEDHLDAFSDFIGSDTLQPRRFFD